MPFAENRGLRIHYIVEGSGPPLLLHHGFTGSHRDWESFGVVDELKDHFQLIMPTPEATVPATSRTTRRVTGSSRGPLMSSPSSMLSGSIRPTPAVTRTAG